MNSPKDNKPTAKKTTQNGTRVFSTVNGQKSPTQKKASTGAKASASVRKSAVPVSKVAGQRPATTAKRKKKNSLSTSIIKFVTYIAFIIIVSALLSKYIISVGNDVFAFLKDDTAITVEIPEGASTGKVARILSKNDIINHPNIFKMYTNMKKDGSSYYTDGFKSGSFELSPDTNYDDLIYLLSNSVGAREVVRLTFPEGSTIDEIIDILIKGGVQNTKEEYIDVIENYDFNYRFVNELDTKSFKNGRKYRLEGYIFPDTYDFYTDASAVSVIDKFLVNFDNKFDETYYDAAKQQGYSVDQLITLASLIEKESRRSADMGKISSVFHNRLKNRANYPYLQSDATIQYAFPERKAQITPDDLKYDSPYNTYIYSGLPPSAVANPGLDAITSALFPEKTNYYYFVANTVGETLFSSTLEGHNANIAQIMKEKAQS